MGIASCPSCPHITWTPMTWASTCSADPTRTQADACCGQTTYNTGLMKCCAFGKADNEKHLVEVDFSCPKGSTEIDWEVHGVQLDHEMMDMNMMEMMGFNLMGPLDF